MMKPDYKHSIVNLMSSIVKASGGRHSYPSLKVLPPTLLSKYKNIILISLDGLGNDIVNKYSLGLFSTYNCGAISTVFPSATTAAMTVFYSGFPPQQSGLLTWWMWYKHQGVIGSALPSTDYLHHNVDLPLDLPSLRLQRRYFLIAHKSYYQGTYTKKIIGKGRSVPFTSLPSFIRTIKKTVILRKKKFIHAYWSGYDHDCHYHAKNSKRAVMHFLTLEYAIAQLASKIEDAVIIITADHGHITLDPAQKIMISDHPQLQECLLLPLTGEPRAVMCFLRMGTEKQFVNYVKKHLSHACTLVKGSDLIKRGYYGVGKQHVHLRDRVGDYVLLCKENYSIYDPVMGKIVPTFKGSHGGMSTEEMEVPLIVIELPSRSRKSSDE